MGNLQIDIKDGYVAIHSIDQDDRQEKSVRYVSPGTFGRAVSQGVKFDTGLLPEHCVAYKQQGYTIMVATVTSETIENVKFARNLPNNRIKIEEFKIPIPPMLWIYELDSVNRNLRHMFVHGLDNDQLKPTSKIYYPPFGNVHANGDICIGEALGHKSEFKYKSLYGLTSIPSAFITSVFNTDLEPRFKKQLDKPACLGFFKFANGMESFPYEVLASRNLTFKTLWGGMQTDEDE